MPSVALNEEGVTGCKQLVRQLGVIEELGQDEARHSLVLVLTIRSFGLELSLDATPIRLDEAIRQKGV
jgi:hypothetical protein